MKKIALYTFALAVLLSAIYFFLAYPVPGLAFLAVGNVIPFAVHLLLSVSVTALLGYYLGRNKVFQKKGSAIALYH